ncbi:MAG: ATP-binding cassette domain-containing protein [Deltaproteobacteria bacterium]|nr:ATP-binding cassette domain-containing protein [Deltaproteobacteria bacterium]
MTEKAIQYSPNSHPAIEARNLCKNFTVYVQGRKATLKAVDRVNLKIFPGKTLGLVGESGSGKSTIAFTMVHYYQPTSGEIIHYDKGTRIHIEGMLGRAFRQRMQMVFQDPYSSLDPRQTLKTIIEHPLKLHTHLNRRQRLDAIIDILHQVGLDAGQLYRYPHEFSGGQRQRIAIARALAVNPQVIICDEPVSALDVSVQAQILNLLKKLQEEQGLAYLFVSHDLNVVRHISHEVAVIYMGRVVERAPTEMLFEDPSHPYTRALMASMPGLDRKDAGVNLIGEISSPIDPPPGCRLASRCPVAMDQCKSIDPELKDIAPGHAVACVHYG